MADNIYTVKTIFSAVNDLSRPLSMMTSDMNKFNKGLYYLDKQLSDVMVKTGLFVAALTTGFALVAKEAAWLEVAIVKMASKFDGSIIKAKDMVTQIQLLAKDSPLSVKPAVQAADMLLTSGVKNDEVLAVLKQLGDLSQGKDETLSTLARGYSRILSEDRVTREHLDRFVISGGVPIYQALADVMGVDMTTLAKNIKGGEVGFDELQLAINHLTKEGAIYHDAMLKQMGTLTASYNRFIESISLVAQVLGSVTNEVYKKYFNLGGAYLDDTFELLKKYFDPKAFSELLPKRDKKGNMLLDEDGKPIMAYQNKKARLDSEGNLLKDAQGNVLYEVLYRTTKATDLVRDSLDRFLLTVSKLAPKIEPMLMRLEDGTSLFYDFMYVLEHLVKGVKLVIDVFKVLFKVFDLPIIGDFVKLIAAGIAFVAPLGLILSKVLLGFNQLGASIQALLGTNFIKIFTVPLKNALHFQLLLIQESIKKFIPKIFASFSKIASFFGKLIPLFSKISVVVANFLSVFTHLMLFFKFLVDQYNWAKDIISSAAGGFDIMITSVKNFSYYVGEALENVKNMVLSFFTGDFVALFYSLLKTLWDLILIIPIGIIDALALVIPQMKNWGENLSEFATGGLQDVINKRLNNVLENVVTINVNDKTKDDKEVEVIEEDNDSSPLGKNPTKVNLVFQGMND